MDQNICFLKTSKILGTWGFPQSAHSSLLTPLSTLAFGSVFIAPLQTCNLATFITHIYPIFFKYTRMKIVRFCSIILVENLDFSFLF